MSKRMQEKKLIAILINQNVAQEKILYAINTVFAQTYDNFDILLLGNRLPQFRFDSIDEVIMSNENSNVNHIDFYFPRYYCTYLNLIKYIFEYMNLHEERYVYILTNGNAFYHPAAMAEIVEKVQPEDKIVLGNSVNYSEDDIYSGEFTSGECIPTESLAEMIQSYLTKDMNENWQVSGLFRNDIMDNIYNCKMSIRYLPNVFGLRCIETKKNYIECEEIEADKIPSLNYTEVTFVKNCVSLLKKREFTSEEILQLKRIQRSLIHNASKVWGRRLNAKWLSDFINEMLKITEQKVRNFSLLKYERVNRRKEKLKVVFFCHQYQTWPSLKSVYLALKKMGNAHVTLVYIEEFHKNSNREKNANGNMAYNQEGLKIISYKEYQLREENPDIAFFVSPYSFVPEGFSVDEVAKIVGRCVYIPYGFTFETELEEFVRLRYKIAMMYLAWKVICDDQFNVELGKKYSYTQGKNFVAWGNPRLDVLDNLPMEEDCNYISKLKKEAAGRKIILWNTHHSISEKEKTFSTWTQYGLSIIKYISLHKDIFCVWRPHPLFWNALKTYMGNTEYEDFLSEIKKLENLFIDTYESYLAAFYVADIFLTDASSLAKEFVFMNKPAILTLWDKDVIINTELRKCFYIPQNMQEIEEIMHRLVNGFDERAEQRKQYVKKYKKGIGIGEYIKDKIIKDLEEELKRLEL